MAGGVTAAEARPTNDERIRAALWFAEHGFGVFSVWSANPDGSCRCPKGATCDNPGKHPITVQGFHDATTDPTKIRTLLSAGSEPNYGLVCPDGVFALDVDGEGVGRLAELEAAHGALPETLRTRTAHGEHIFLRWPDALPRPIGQLFGFVTRWGSGAGAGYVIGPRSVHASGAVYAPGTTFEVAPMPEAWAAAALEAKRPVPAAPGTFVIETGGYVLPDVVPASESRYEAIRAYTAHLYNHGLGKDELWSLVRDVLAPRFEQPLTEPEIRSRFGRVTADLEQRLGPPRATGQPVPPEPIDPATFPLPEDRGKARLSSLGEVEYVEDLLRPGRIVVWAAEEGSGKSFAVSGELAIRVAYAGGSFAGTWPVRRTGPVLVLSEMHPDDDYVREELVLQALELTRANLDERYFRLDLMTAAGGRPALTVPEWREWVVTWLRDRGALLLVVDTATGATQVDPWGREIQAVYASLRMMLAAYPGLAVVLIVHTRKPAGGQGGHARGLSDVLGEWGRWSDVVVMQENDGGSLERAKITTRKRVRNQRRIVATKRGGLLVEPMDIEGLNAKVPAGDIIAAIQVNPGLTYGELGQKLGVAKVTATRYVDQLGTQVHRSPTGPRGSIRVYLAADSLTDRLIAHHAAGEAVSEHETSTASEHATTSRETEEETTATAISAHHEALDVGQIEGSVSITGTPLLQREGDRGSRGAPSQSRRASRARDRQSAGDALPARRPDGTAWCLDFAGHASRHRDVEADPWCELCSPKVGP